MMINVTLYTRSDADNTEAILAELEALSDRFPHQVAVMHVDTDEALSAAYGGNTPLVEIGPYKLKYPFDGPRLQVALGAASDRKRQMEEIGGEDHVRRVEQGKTITRSDRLTMWFSDHYMLVFNLVMALFVGLPFLAPVLMKTGAEIPATVIYKLYSPFCHQLGYRSWFLFGEQAAYPRALAEQGGITYEEASGLAPDDLLGGREFYGNDRVGYKVAICERDVAIYGSLLIFGLVFSTVGKKLKPLHWALWVLIGMVPMGLDGVSQLPSLLPLPEAWKWLPMRESTPLLRTITGALFGLATGWFGYPYVKESVDETRIFLLKKTAIAQAQKDPAVPEVK
ncbi:MAG TPA: DUF2085 domain-containing protein [Anaerolineaceae bacterium]|nr:DUF2085 domain-containing protein [Anaerolineaceae bacterium]HPN51163.1 DUF2085 domain-containing protein [Anaerolineaceae bacterium]